MKFQNQVAIVTGAASGIGKASAEEFAKNGATVIIADLPGSQGEAVAKGIVENGGKAAFIPCDMTDAAQVNHLVEETVRRYGSIDILHNNAGLGMTLTYVEEITEEFYDKLMAVNMKGVFLGVRAVAPYMKKAGRGKIITTGSTSAVRARAKLSLYGATKGAVVAFCKSIALELAPFGIRVNVINPVITNTPLADPQQIKEYAAGIPLGRIAEPVDIARAAVFLASEEASMITGVELQVDGGRCV